MGAGVTLSAFGDIDVISLSHNSAEANGLTITVGAVGIGAIIGDATASGTTKAYLMGKDQSGTGSLTAGSLTITAQALNEAITETEAAGGGIISGMGADSDATISPVVMAYINEDVNVSP